MIHGETGYSKPQRINSGYKSNFDPKWGCLIPLLLFVIVVGLIAGIAYYFDLK